MNIPNLVGIASLLITLVAAVVATLTYWLTLQTRNRKALFYEVIATTPVVTVSDDVKDEFRITYRGSEVHNVTVLILRFWNAGNQAIQATDFVQPLKVSFGAAEILLTAWPDMFPKGLIDGGSGTREWVKLQPFLMNPGDYFIVRLLLAQYNGEINPDGRIVGVSRIRRIRRSQISQRQFVFGAIMAIIGLTSYLVSLLPFPLMATLVLAAFGWASLGIAVASIWPVIRSRIQRS